MAKLSQSMEKALINTYPGDIMAPGGTRAALMRRGLVHDMTTKTPGQLTEEGAKVRSELIEKACQESDKMARDAIAEDDRIAQEYQTTAEIEADQLRAEYPDAPAARRVAIRRRLLILGVTLVPGVPDGEDDLEKDCLRARYTLAGTEEREKIQARLRELGTVVFPEGTPEHADYRARLRRALMDKDQWSGMLEV